MSKIKRKYTATLTGNQRDVHLMYPKVLLKNIKYEDGTEFRDHNWVLAIYFPKRPPGHSKKHYQIAFTAQETEYTSLHGIKKKLVGLKDIQYL